MTGSLCRLSETGGQNPVRLNYGPTSLSAARAKEGASSMHSVLRAGLLQRVVLSLCLLGWLGDAPAAGPPPGAIPPLAEVVAAKRDVWGELAMRQPNGASYEFFEPLLPPPRYVNADFRYYPLVLSAPGAAVKARLVSNGSGVNLRGGARSWKDVGTPVV